MATTTASPSTPLGPSACEADAKALQVLEEMTTNADRVQEKVLADILDRNAQTEYLARFKLGGATDRATFKSLIPVIVYEDIQPEIQRIVDGDRSAILTVDPITELITSSGTSAGKNKLIPSTRVEMDRRLVIFSFIRAVINSYVPELDKGKGLHFMSVRSETKTPGDLTAHPLLTSFYKSDRFRNRPSDPYNAHTSPIAAILCADTFQSMYTQMLCGFLHRIEILHIGAPFASGLLRIIHFLQLHWEELVADIAAGSLSHKITDPSIRESMHAHEMSKPDPELASSIATECSTGEWAGIIKRVWPNTKYLDVIVTGAMAQYIPTLEYYSGGLPMVSKMYASSECFFGLNLQPMCKPSDISYTVMPNMAYFEFLPCEPSTTAGPTRLVDVTDVEIGKEYEVVVTNSAGLYRYRVGDIVRVTGFHNATPQFRFVRRKNVVLSIEVDKTDEVDLQAAVERAAQLLRPYKASVVEYTSRVNTQIIPGHYVIYWELVMWEEGRWPDAEALEQCCLEMEEALSSEYRQGRAVGKTIGPLEIRVVRKGTFDEVMDYAVSQGASIGQYKLPRCVNLTPIIDLLESRVVSTHFSQGCPKWTSWTSSNSS